jgi:ribosomal protein L37AE/L43A
MYTFPCEFCHKPFDSSEKLGVMDWQCPECKKKYYGTEPEVEKMVVSGNGFMADFVKMFGGDTK